MPPTKDAGRHSELVGMRAEVQEVCRQEQELKYELDALHQSQTGILKALQEMRSGSSTCFGSQAGQPHRTQMSAATRVSSLRSTPPMQHLQTLHTQHTQQTDQSQDWRPVVKSATRASSQGEARREPRRVRRPGAGSEGGSSKPDRSRSNLDIGHTENIFARHKLYEQGRQIQINSLWKSHDNPDGSVIAQSTDSAAPAKPCHTRCWRGVTRFCKALTHNSRAAQLFDVFIGIAIIANALTIGWSVQLELEGKGLSELELAETCFLTLYVLEICIRLIADGRHNFHNPWFLMDFSLVALGVLSDWILNPILSLLESSSTTGILEKVLIIRILRLLRLVRALRTLEMFKDMWKLVRGVVGSARTVVSACILIVGSIYIFACVGVELVTKDAELKQHALTEGIMEKYFPSLPRVMLTLVQFATFDSIASIYFPVIMIRPYLLLYFMPILLVVPVCLMNLVTAVIVEHAIECAKADADVAAMTVRRRLKELEPQIKEVFAQLDFDGDKHIQKSELRHIPVPDDLTEIIQPDKLADLFELLDLDGSGELDEKEFINGVCHLALSTGKQGVSIESTQMLQLLRQQTLLIDHLREKVDFLSKNGKLDCLRGEEFAPPTRGGIARRASLRRASADFAIADSGHSDMSSTELPTGGSPGQTWLVKTQDAQLEPIVSNGYEGLENDEPTVSGVWRSQQASAELQ